MVYWFSRVLIIKWGQRKAWCVDDKGLIGGMNEWVSEWMVLHWERVLLRIIKNKCWSFKNNKSHKVWGQVVWSGAYVGVEFARRMFFSPVSVLTLCAICWLPEKTRWRSSLGCLLLLSLGASLEWDCQGTEFGDSFRVSFANESVWQGVGFLWCSWPMALNFFWFQWAHCITQMASCKWECVCKSVCMHT